MKKLTALFLVAVIVLSCLVGCGATENEDDKLSIMSLSYTSVDYFGGYTAEYYFDFEKNILTKHSFFPGDEESDNTETLAEHDWHAAKVHTNGTIAHTTAIFGFMLAGLVIQDIIKE